MLVKDLIKELNKLPPESKVWCYDDCGIIGYNITPNLDEDGEVGIYFDY